MVKHAPTIRRQIATNCLSVFDHFVNLALKGLNFKRRNSVTIWRPISRDTRLRDTVLFWYIRFADLICKTTSLWHRNEIKLGLYRHTSMGNWSDQDHFVWGWKRFTVDSNYFKAVCWRYLFAEHSKTSPETVRYFCRKHRGTEIFLYIKWIQDHDFESIKWFSRYICA